MEELKYSGRAKGIWIAIHLVCLAIFSVSLVMGVKYLEVTMGNVWDSVEGKEYEQSAALSNTLEYDCHWIFDFVQEQELLETDGKYDGQKYIDVMDFSQRGYQLGDTAPLEYKISDLYNWGSSESFQNRQYEDLYEGERGFEFAVEGSEFSYSESGDLILPTGVPFREQFAPKGYDSLTPYSKENNIPIEECFYALYNTLLSIDDYVNNYTQQKSDLDADDTNLRYMVEKEGKIVSTNIPAGEKSRKSVEVERGLDGYTLSAYVNIDYPVSDSYEENANYYNRFSSLFGWILTGLIVGILGVFASLLYMTIASGHVSGKEGITLNWLDKPKTELAVLFWGVVGFWVVGTILSAAGQGSHSEGGGYLVLLAVVVLAGGAISLTGYLSLVRRIKTRTLGKNSFCHMLVRAIKTIVRGSKVSSRLIIAFAIYLVAMLMCIAMGGFGFFIAIVLNIFVAVLITKDALARQKIMDGLQLIAGGELDYKINLDDMNSLNLDMADAVNQVGGGLEAAVEQSIKNERMKTDLITNVSHDIKTPLTSIINYVDLLKREDIQNDKAKGYIDILDMKSQRLKQLTEDLVEASKISSGNVALELGKMDFGEVLQQALGEFGERFENRNLQVVVNELQKPAVIEGDGRRIWRIIENLFQNVVKYAMPGSRVYVELVRRGRNMEFTVKNISENPLNISADELTERFIRGDVSRSTEGSGLGLSIAKSLTTLQKGQFNIYLDGDLFKVTVTFGLIE